MAAGRMNIAVIGSGIAGLSCAWLLSRQHQVTLYEKDDYLGGHSHTVEVEGEHGPVPVDTGFIVFNEQTYPNLTAFFDYLDVPVAKTDMSFGVSLNGGATEYSGTDLNGLFAQRMNLLRPSFWGMLRDVVKFYRASPDWLCSLTPSTTLGQLLSRHGFSRRFIDDHIIPMGAAIWSTPAEQMLDYPALAFLRFCTNHGLLQLTDRPQWLTVQGGSREYVSRIRRELWPDIRLNACVREVRRFADRVEVVDYQGNQDSYDHVVMASHSDTTLQLLSEPDEQEQWLLGSFSFQRNRVVLHSDSRFMPANPRAWASWNYLGAGAGDGPSVSYWMNRLQHLEGKPLFVTLNPATEPEQVHGCYLYDHPVFNRQALEAQQELWSLQGHRRTWYCGAWFGYGFHEDGLQSGLAVAEALGGQSRPWHVKGKNDRLVIPEACSNAALSREGVL